MLYVQFALGTWTDPAVLDGCPGYNATNVKTTGAILTADLVLGGKACNVYGNDTAKLTLEVEYETGKSFPYVRKKWPIFS